MPIWRLLPARLARRHSLPTADSIIYATALAQRATVWTQDDDLAELANVRYLARASLSETRVCDSVQTDSSRRAKNAAQTTLPSVSPSMPITPIVTAVRRERSLAGKPHTHGTVPIRSPYPAAGVAFDDIRPRMLEAVTIADGYDRFPGADSGNEFGGR